MWQTPGENMHCCPRYLIFFQYIGSRYRYDTLHGQLLHVNVPPCEHIWLWLLFLQWGSEGASKSAVEERHPGPYRGECGWNDDSGFSKLSRFYTMLSCDTMIIIHNSYMCMYSVIVLSAWRQAIYDNTCYLYSTFPNTVTMGFTKKWKANNRNKCKSYLKIREKQSPDTAIQKHVTDEKRVKARSHETLHNDSNSW